jgi:FKBP-type peptidyl-prolyl cis-trans isomerase
MWLASRYGYGKHGVGSAIPPNSELIMEFEILAINNVSQPEEYIDDL